jgi:hypothetical protein
MVLQAILIIAIIIIGAYIFGIGTDFFDDVLGSIDEKIAKQNEVPDPETFENANLAKDRGTRICDLQMTWYGAMWETDPFGFDPIGLFEQRYVFIGSITHPISQLQPAQDVRTFTYQWTCVGETTTTTDEVIPVMSTSTGGSEICRTGARGSQVCVSLSFLDLFGHNLQKNTQDGIEQLSLLALGGSETDRETIRIKFIGRSLSDNGKFLQSPDLPTLGTPNNPITKSVTLSRGDPFPRAFSIGPINLSDVTEDNYVIEYWIDEYRLNAKAPGAIFTKDLCKPGLETC